MNGISGVSLSNGMIRRTSNPIVARKIWEAIGNIEQNKKKADIENIVSELEEASSISSTESLEQIKKCTEDKLLKFQKVVNQGMTPSWVIINLTNIHSGEESFIFHVTPSLNESKKESKERDWYCFECHTAGYVYSCRTCFRKLI